MATYKGKQSVLDEALGEFGGYGFQLVKPDDHLLELYFKDKRIAVYNQTKVTFDIVREGCRNFFVNKLAQDYNDCYGEELRHGS